MTDFLKQHINIGTLITVFPFIITIIIYIITMRGDIDRKLDRECFLKDSVQKTEGIEYIKRGIDKIDKDLQDLKNDVVKKKLK